MTNQVHTNSSYGFRKWKRRSDRPTKSKYESEARILIVSHRKWFRIGEKFGIYTWRLLETRRNGLSRPTEQRLPFIRHIDYWILNFAGRAHVEKYNTKIPPKSPYRIGIYSRLVFEGDENQRARLPARIQPRSQALFPELESRLHWRDRANGRGKYLLRLQTVQQLNNEGT